MTAYTILTDPHRMFLEVNSSAAITRKRRSQDGRAAERHICGYSQTVKPGRMRTTPPEEIALKQKMFPGNVPSSRARNETTIDTEILASLCQHPNIHA